MLDRPLAGRKGAITDAVRAKSSCSNVSDVEACVRRDGKAGLEGNNRSHFPITDDGVHDPTSVLPPPFLSKGQFINGTEDKALPGIVDSTAVIRRPVIVILTQAAIGVTAFLGIMVNERFAPSISGQETEALGHSPSQLNLQAVVV